jgi:hypothetical protein
MVNISHKDSTLYLSGSRISHILCSREKLTWWDFLKVSDPKLSEDPDFHYS